MRSTDNEFTTDNEVTDNVVDNDEDFLPSIPERTEDFNYEISTFFLGSLKEVGYINSYGAGGRSPLAQIYEEYL